jgi:hypothetical protein
MRKILTISALCLIMPLLLACQPKSMAVELKKKILPELESKKCSYKDVLIENKIEFEDISKPEDQEDGSRLVVVFFIIDADGYLGRTGFRFILYVDEKGCIIKQKVTNYNY